jgi:hypothetical protein
MGMAFMSFMGIKYGKDVKQAEKTAVTTTVPTSHPTSQVTNINIEK